MNTLVIYHANCSDGFCCAWLMHKVYPEAEFIPAKYGDDPPKVHRGQMVYICDFSYKRDTMVCLNEESRDGVEGGLIVLDHHKTAEADCDGLDFCVFDSTKSGGRLTWDLLQDNALIPSSIRPWLVDYTEDRDLWRWKLERSREINCAIRSYSMEFDVWDELADRNSLDLIPEGIAIERYRQQLVANMVGNSREVELAGMKVRGVNCTVGDLISEVAGELASGYPFGFCWFDVVEGYRVFSLRSRDGGADVSEIAKRFGGGGHKNAAGFRMPI